MLNKIVKKDSYSETVFVFKHSTRCSISNLAKQRLESNWNTYFEDKEVYFLDLLQHRLLSNQLAEQLNVQHQSPQLIAIKSGVSIYRSSHLAITVKAVYKAITEH
tara:strand:+ start:316 stop:630 length:315 start_codon:yes stop_codon:yes gene_type:complete